MARCREPGHSIGRVGKQRVKSSCIYVPGEFSPRTLLSIMAVNYSSSQSGPRLCSSLSLAYAETPKGTWRSLLEAEESEEEQFWSLPAAGMKQLKDQVTRSKKMPGDQRKMKVFPSFLKPQVSVRAHRCSGPC